MTRLAWTTTLLLAAAAAPGAETVWIEGEKPTATNWECKLAGWGNSHYLSGGNWLSVSVDAGKVDKDVPADGVLLEYAFTTAEAGKRELFSRIGFEFVRSVFEWRIDGGPWKRVGPDELTTDLMEISNWCEVAWLKLGDVDVSAGKHKLEIRLPKTKDAKGKTARILYACDAICLHAGPFHPNSKHKPGESWRDAKDERAGRHVFKLPEPASEAARSSVKLNGLWEVCRHDEQVPREVAAPIRDVPAEPHWKAIPVPSDKNTSRPDLLFAHRLWYRTRVDVPASCAGRSFHVVFPQNNLNTTVVVNGVACGFDKNAFARVQIDVTKGVRPGVNEIRVGIRDAWYGYSTSPDDPMKLRRRFNLPIKFLSQGFQDLAYPIWHHAQSGILVTPTFVAAGKAYVSDVFCKPSVAKKRLALAVTVNNPSSGKVTGAVVCEAVNDRTGRVEKAFAARPFTLAGRAEKTLDLAEPWEKPKLWWPDEPNLYRLRATVRIGGKAVDVSETTFGFREWTWGGRYFKLNGVVWRLWADCFQAGDRDEWLTFYRNNNERMMRFWGTSWKSMAPEEALDFFDRNGVIVRRSGILDGEAIGYHAVEHDPALRKKYGSEIKMQLMENWRDRIVAQVKGERNHPSVMIWSIENEWLYINCINLHGKHMDEFEAAVKKVSDAVQAADPTRATMNDGGGAHKNNAMPVAGDHYVVGAYNQYPALAYSSNPKGGGRGRWEWDERRPRFIGEDFYITGNNPKLSYFGGEEAFQGKAATRPAASILARILMEGYRWSGQSAWHFWMGQNDAPGQYASYHPRSVLCRQWDWSFGSEQKVRRTLRLYNDTRHDDPLDFTWALTLAGKKVAGRTERHEVAPGQYEQIDLDLAMPTVSARQEGELAFALRVGGEQVYGDTKAVSVLPPAAPTAKLPAAGLAVYDPKGTVAAWLERRGVAFTPVDDLKPLPDDAKVLLVGPDALTEAESTSSRLAAYALDGHRVIVLEQTHPLKYQGMPAAMEAATNVGTTAFGEDLGHPVLRGLRQKDFFTWAGDEIVYRNAYRKPARGARSLVQCHLSLTGTAVAEVPVGEGLILVCQLLVGEKLAANAVAQRLLANLIDHAAAYRLEFRKVAACAEGGGQLARTLDAIGLKHAKVAAPVAALGAGGAKVAIVSATPANLKTLAGEIATVERFTRAGGWLVLNGLTPEGLADYNRIVGVEHMIRRFRRERIGFPAARHPLMAGLTLGDVVLYSSRRIFPWTQGNYVAGDVFEYVVDYEDVAPFAAFGKEDLEHPDRNLSNMVNGMVSADAWKYIVNVEAPQSGPVDFRLPLPKDVELVEVEWTGNTFYYPVTKVKLFFDGEEKSAYTFETRPDNDVQTFRIDPPIKGRNLTLRLADWLRVPGKRAVTGLDNIRLKAKRPPEFHKKVRPLLSVGGMLAYPRGRGGIVLCNLLFKDAEDVPLNKTRKRTILATLLRNLKAPFAGGRTIVAGAKLTYTPIDLSKQANQYRTERGWFGDRRFTFKDLPTGRQTFAGVPYEIYDFPTSPVPTVVMLGGRRVPNNLSEAVRGIPVERKADALFFLHTARIDRRRSRNDLRKGTKFEMLRYVVTYSDGKHANIPVYSEIDIDDYRQRAPRAIRGAQIAWTRPYAGTDRVAVAYSMQWNNPRPDVAIRSIDVTYGPQKRGAAALIAVTAASAR